MAFVRFTRDRQDNARQRAHNNQRKPPRVYDGHVIPAHILNQAVEDAQMQLKSRIFCSIWSYVAHPIAAVIWSKASTLSDGILYFIAAICLLSALAYCIHHPPEKVARFYNYIKRAWDCTDLKGVNPLLWILASVGFACIFDLYRHVGILYQGVDELRSTTKLLDAKVIKIRQDLDTRFYKPAIADDGWWKPVDDRIVTVLARMGISRSYLGWGCFEQGTLIQVDEFGLEVTIERLLYGEHEYVYNGAMRVPIRYISVGNETGYLYEVTTMDLFSVNVTATHAMRICAAVQDESGAFECEYNIAAQDVREGNWTVTRNGYQQIKSIRKYAVRDVPVYNIWLDMPENAALSSRILIANGVETFDLLRQKENH